MEGKYGGLLTDDQYFLLSFIMGTYFGPHLKKGEPFKSAWQRYAENLPPYKADDLANSWIKTVVLESVYYYILRKAPRAVVVSRPLLLEFIHGNLPIPLQGRPTPYPRFNNMFPPALHQPTQTTKPCDTIQSIVFLDNPQVGHVALCHVERFKRLTGLKEFQLDRKSAILHELAHINDSCDVKMTMAPKSDESNAIPLCNSVQTASPGPLVSFGQSPANCSSTQDHDQGIIFVPYLPTKQEWANVAGSIKNGFAVTGSAAKGHIGPVVGLMDIGESEDAYLFRVALPGVKRDDRDFSCEVESNGTVLIKGVTVTGEKTINRYSQVFEMKSQNLCPPGPFSISFALPGPVDPQQFHGTFSTDGILEGIALKERRITG